MRGDIAVVGMTIRAPGACDLAGYWANLAAGHCTVSRFDPAQLRAAGVAEAEIADPAYVPVRGVLDGIETFDGTLFRLSRREAELTDPQHRIALECAWTALEHATIRPDTADRIGVFAGCSPNTYLLNALLARPDLTGPVGDLALMIANEKDHLATRIAYRLGLRGPAVTTQTACSSSLVAVHLARTSILAGDCDVALAGGVSIRVPQRVGYLYDPEGITSPDGVCRAFDVRAQGTIAGEGCGFVVLKKLDRAVADGDPIHAVLSGSAINNDGNRKIGYTAPSVEGQAEVLRAAQLAAGIDPSMVDYIETHGTGTQLGDAIEVEALAEVFRGQRSGDRPCFLGSVKPSIGHLDAAAGIAGLIKAILAVSNGVLPASLGCDTPNPELPLAAGPFEVVTGSRPWPETGQPRVAGASSFGMGGTNAHVIVRQAPAGGPVVSGRGAAALPISAASETSLRLLRERMETFLADRPEISPATVATTLVNGRMAHPFRQVLLVDEPAGRRSVTALPAGRARRRPAAAFLFSGQGSQFPGMAAHLAATQPVFRTSLDRCAMYLRADLGFDLAEVLCDPDHPANGQLDSTWLTQPALLAMELSLTELLRDRGIEPKILLGHSVGEYAAHVAAGALTMKDALALVAVRGRLMQSTPAGAMTSVRATPDELRAVADLSTIDIAAVNAKGSITIAGPVAAIAAAEVRLTAAGHRCHRLPGDRAFHSRLMDAILTEFAAAASKVSYRPIRIPVVSNVTGEVLPVGTIVDAGYWVDHLRGQVRFATGLDAVAATSCALLLEVGPGHVLTSLAAQQGGLPSGWPTTPARNSDADSAGVLRAAFGAAWTAGFPIRWPDPPAGRSSEVPTYAFDAERFWIDPVSRPAADIAVAAVQDVPTDPGAAVGTAVSQAWQGLLGGRPPVVDRNFFDDGGDSLLAVRLVARLRRDLGIDLSVLDVLRAPRYGEIVSRASELVATASSRTP